ncbi:MAG: nickel pincer cofactor biosynthesis protein LarC [Okeania sp. SIO2F4]|uniref:nickel pincer cofactor biosynthesis protein LarC n=1 Tax=Okeania sp. SIO2F4 TaxID=2607790 RepID=UPI00142AA239|nr:nickel pincer cofactor biosynthesis protein LarC [Okeania sp. SIO2F4]NES07313.1 nickel pincer cofactor biosynthesis protein LarC [Okeania sp. SIO2F4]
MNKIAYLECPTGIAGDMCLGALVHVGVPLDYLIEKLNLLGISQEYQLSTEKVHRNGLVATKFHVKLTHANPEDGEPLTFDNHHHHHHDAENNPSRHKHYHAHNRHLPEIETLIKKAGLPQRAEAWSLEVFRKLAEAEAAVHGVAPEQVHFHEVGATDAIIDIVGTCLGLDWLNIDELYCSPLPTGGGIVRTAHGLLPVPVPAVLKLWELHNVPIYSNSIEKELCTPTGSAIACTIASGFDSPPSMSLQCVGLGAGSQDLAIPNILRLWIGEGKVKTQYSQIKKSDATTSQHSHLETVSVLETQIDDCTPQAIAYTFDVLFAAGALDVFTQPVTMKKSRLGVLLTVICTPEKLSACEEVIFRETTTLGIRQSIQQRAILEREIHQLETEYGAVRLKVAKMGDKIVNVQPEYEDCATLARQENMPLMEVQKMVLQRWYKVINMIRFHGSHASSV